MQTLTRCNATFMSTRTAAGQFKGQFKGAMEEMSRGFKMQTLTYCDATFMSTRTAVGQFKGALWSLTSLSRLAGRWRPCQRSGKL